MVSVRKLTEATEQLKRALALAEQYRKEKEHAYEQVAAQRQRADKANDLLTAMTNRATEAEQCNAHLEWLNGSMRDASKRGPVCVETQRLLVDSFNRMIAERDEARRTIEVLAKGHAPAAIRIPGALESAGQLMDRVGVKALEVQESRRFGMAEVILGTGGLSRHDLEAVIRALKAAQ